MTRLRKVLHEAPTPALGRLRTPEGLQGLDREHLTLLHELPFGKDELVLREQRQRMLRISVHGPLGLFQQGKFLHGVDHHA